MLFFLGSVLMRSAGCIVNDILDRKFDKLVVRTKDRPIASGKISVKLSLFYAVILCLLAFIVLINFNLFTIKSPTFVGFFVCGMIGRFEYEL